MSIKTFKHGHIYRWIRKTPIQAHENWTHRETSGMNVVLDGKPRKFICNWEKNGTYGYFGENNSQYDFNWKDFLDCFIEYRIPYRRIIKNLVKKG